MKKILIILFFLIFGCETIVIIELPDEQNLVVVEGWITNNIENQQIRLTRSNSFSGEANPIIIDANVTVLSEGGITYSYSHNGNGYYESDIPFNGVSNEAYRLIIELSDGTIIESDWNVMPIVTEIVLLSIDSFNDSDPVNPQENITVYFPRITVRDSANFKNYYRWILYKNAEQMTDPESITLQEDQFFDGNFIPNVFDQFEYREGDEVTVELHSINKGAFDFLTLVKSQITTLGASSSSTPSQVVGNLNNLNNPDQIVLGFFGTTAISAESSTIENN